MNPELDFSNMSDICEVYERVDPHACVAASALRGRACVHGVFGLSSRRHRKRNGMERREKVREMERALPSDRSAGRGQKIRFRCYPHQQPVRQGRRKLYPEAELRSASAFRRR